MRISLAGAISAASLVGLVHHAHAQQTPAPPTPSGAVEMAMRAGPSILTGEAERGYGMADQLGVPLSLGLDLGYRINERIYVGAMWAMGFGFVRPEPCPASYRCPPPAVISDLGGGARFHLKPIGRLDPWLGAGIALAVEGSSAKRTEYMVAGTSTSSSNCLFGSCTGNAVNYDASTTRYGLDGLVEVGIDYRLSPRTAVGFSLSAFFGKYFGAALQEKKNGTEISSGGRSIEGGAMHVWIFPAAHLVIDFVPPPRAPSPTTAPPSQPGSPPSPTTAPPPGPEADPNEITL